MWDNVLKDPFIRVILVVFIGILAFSVLFSFFGGSFSMGEMNNYQGNMMGGDQMGYTSGLNYGGLISSLLALLVNILILVLMIAVVAGVIVWVKNNMFTGNNSKMVQMFTNDPILRIAVIVTTAIIGFVLLFALLNNFMGTGTVGHQGYGMPYTGYGSSLGVTGLIVSLIKVLMFILVVSLVIAAIVYIRDQYNKGAWNTVAAANPKVTVNTDSDVYTDKI